MIITINIILLEVSKIQKQNLKIAKNVGIDPFLRYQIISDKSEKSDPIPIRKKRGTESTF